MERQSNEFVSPILQGKTLFSRGGFGELNVAFRHQEDETYPTLVAVKTIQKGTVEEVDREISALKLLSPHSNIISLYTAYSGKAITLRRNLVFEFCPIDLDLSMTWRKRHAKPHLSTCTIEYIVSDLFSALEHCHANKITHRDIKPGNLLIATCGTIKLCDFGLALPIGDSISRSRTGQGLCTLHYRPPEVLLGSVGDQPSADFFSAGVVIAELLTGTTLFPGRNVLDQLSKICFCLGSPDPSNWPGIGNFPDGNATFAPQEPRSVACFVPRAVECPNILSLLEGCLVLDPERRSIRLSSSHKHPVECATPACRSVLQHELIPKELDGPFFLQSKEPQIANDQGVKVASTRYSFLKPSRQWRRFGGKGSSVPL